jgi:hypothetical protein
MDLSIFMILKTLVIRITRLSIFIRKVLTLLFTQVSTDLLQVAERKDISLCGTLSHLGLSHIFMAITLQFRTLL